MRSGSHDFSDRRKATLRRSLCLLFGNDGELADSSDSPDLVPEQAFRDAIAEAHRCCECDELLAARAPLVFVHNQIARTDEYASVYAQILVGAPLCARMIEWMKDARYAVLCPFIVTIFVDLAVHCPTFKRMFAAAHGFERILFVRSVYPWLKDLASLLWYNTADEYAGIVVNETIIPRMVLKEVADCVDKRESINFWIPFSLISVLREERLRGDEANTDFVNVVVDIMTYCETPDILRATLWAVYFWFKNAADAWQDEDCKWTVHSYLNVPLIECISNIMRNDDREMVEIGLYATAVMWTINKSRYDVKKEGHSQAGYDQIVREMRKHFDVRHILELAKNTGENQVSMYAFIALENFSLYDGNNRLVLYSFCLREFMDVLCGSLDSGTTMQKQGALKLLVLAIEDRIGSDEMNELLRPVSGEWMPVMHLVSGMEFVDEDVGNEILGILYKLLRHEQGREYVEQVAEELVAMLENFAEHEEYGATVQAIMNYWRRLRQPEE